MPGPPVHSSFVTDLLSGAEFAAEFFSCLLEPAVLKLLDLSTLSVENSSFVDSDLIEFHGDLLFSLSMKNERRANIYILFEHKSHPDRDILKQLLKYLYLIHVKADRMVPVLPIVFHHGPEAWNAPRDLNEYFEFSQAEREVLTGRVFEFRYHLIDVKALRIDELRASLEHRAFLEILNAIWDFHESERIRGYLEKYQELFFDDTALEFLRKLLVYIYRVQDIEPEEFRELIPTNISQSRKDIAMTTAERLHQRGREEGLVQGKLEGKLEDARNFLANGVSLEIILKSTGLTREQLIEAGIINAAP